MMALSMTPQARLQVPQAAHRQARTLLRQTVLPPLHSRHHLVRPRLRQHLHHCQHNCRHRHHRHHPLPPQVMTKNVTTNLELGE